MLALTTEIADVKFFEPRVFEDERGFFFESWNAASFNRAVGFDVEFVQDNHSCSVRNVLRGLHYQISQPQGKLVRVIRGRIFDVAVDLRRWSHSFGQWIGSELSNINRREAWIPPGFAHGFVVLSDRAEVLYKATDYYAPAHERCIAWNDPNIGVRWPLSSEPILSPKDKAGRRLHEAEVFE